MKMIYSLIFSLSAFTALASNYPSDYCNAHVRICENGPGVVALVTSGCNSGAYVIGYKKSGILANNSFVDAVLQLNFNNSTVKKDIRITPDWHNLGFLTPQMNLWDLVVNTGYVQINSISIAFSDGKGGWDSQSGANYNYPVGKSEDDKCYSVKTNEDFMTQVPFAAWNIINQIMGR